MRLIFFGDSLTEGDYGGSYVAALRPMLPDDEVINAGVGGDTVINLLRRVDDDVIAQAPDGVFLMVGGNDAISYTQPGVRSYYRQAKGIEGGIVTPDDFATGYRDLLTQLQAAHIHVWVGLTPAEYNAEVVGAIQQYNDLARAAAESLRIPVLDLTEHFPTPEMPDRPPLAIDYILTIGGRVKRGWREFESARAKGGYTFTFDGLHFTPEAAERAARLIADFIRA